MFSVIIPLYNKEISIRNTIQSVLDQTWQDFEIIIVNDGSTDNSASIVESLKNDRIRLIHQSNQGVSAARNRGMQEARNEWLAFLDGDDLWGKEHLEEISSMIKNYPGEKIFVTSFEYSDNRPMFKHQRSGPVFVIDNYFKEAIKESLMWTSTVAIHRSCVDKVGGFDKELKHGEDLEFWVRLVKKYHIVKSQRVTAIYRVNAENRNISSFDYRKSLVFRYRFVNSCSAEETLYFIHKVTKELRSYLSARKMYLFIRLYMIHHKYISLLRVLKLKNDN